MLDYIKGFRKKWGYAPSYEEIIKHLGLSSVSTAHHHVKALEMLGLLKKEENQPRAINVYEQEPLISIPLLGTIAAGEPIEVVEEKETIAVPKSKLPKNGDFFALRVSGNSMIDENINNGDVVIIKSQASADNGQKVVALINGHEITLKKLYHTNGKIKLQPANADMPPIILHPKNIKVQGVVVDILKQQLGFNLDDDSVGPPVLEQKPAKPINKEECLNKWLNTIQCSDCVEGMKSLPDNCIDLVVTSPPYDEIRKYNGFNYDLHATGKELFRILKDGGIAIMVIQDQTKDFAKSLTSFRTIVDWVDNIGFRLFETVIYKKHGAEGAWWTKRFRVDHEYMPIFLKGGRPQYFNKEQLKIPSKHGGKTMTGCATRLTNGTTLTSKKVTINPLKCRGTIWDYVTCGDGTRLKHQHPATFPDKIPYDLIQCFCPENGIVLDPFMGSGTTALAAVQLERNYIGFDISQEYSALAKRRIRDEGAKTKKLFK